MDFEEQLMEGLGRIEMGGTQGVRGLGLILKTPSIDPVAAFAVGAPLTGLGVLGVYHSIDALGKTPSVWGKVGLVFSALVMTLFSLETLSITVAGAYRTVSPDRRA